MFNLEQSIADWREQMLAAGIKTPVPLDELEIHLREEMERQMKSGLNEQKAFEISVPRIGQPEALDSEFKKSERAFMSRPVKICAGIIGMLVGIALMMPAAAQTRHEGMVEFAGLCYAWFGIALLITGALVAFYPYKKRRA